MSWEMEQNVLQHKNGKQIKSENKQYNMKTNRIRLTESQLHNVIKESVKRVLNEQMSDLKEPYYKLNNAINGFVDVLESNYVNDELVQKLKTIQDDVTDFCRHPDMGGNKMAWDSVGF